MKKLAIVLFASGLAAILSVGVVQVAVVQAKSEKTFSSDVACNGSTLALLASDARADDANAAFSVTVGAGHGPGNIMAKAKNGDSVELIGGGQMDAGPETASLSGSYVIRNAAGNVTAAGTWHSTKFLSWEPTEACTGGFEGYVSGTARFKVQLDGIGEAHLSVTCAGCETPIGTDAVTLHIRQGQNFKESVNNEPSGGLFGDGRYMNLFLRQ